VIGTVEARDVLDAIETARVAQGLLDAADQRPVSGAPAGDAEQAAAAVPS
jgi:hypothetical protein